MCRFRRLWLQCPQNGPFFYYSAVEGSEVIYYTFQILHFVSNLFTRFQILNNYKFDSI